MLAGLLLVASSMARADERTPIVCDDCETWNRPEKPFRIFGNVYYVGTHGLASVLVTSPAGHVLFDGALPQSAAHIEASIVALGFRVEDVKLIASSHAHFDHAGGIAALARASGATVVASAAGAQALRAGQPTPDDPQAGFGPSSTRFPKVAMVREVTDGQTLTVGPLAVTAHLTPGHTPGSTTWTFRSCEGARCVDVVYGDSLNAVAAPGFSFRDRAAAFRASIARVAALPCDILVSVHPDFSDTFAKAARRQSGAVDAFIDPRGCREYAAAAGRRLEARLSDEGRGRAH